jgi:hypothetical protein
MTSRQQRDEVAEFLRRRAAGLRGRVAGRARRLWTPAVRRRARVAAWVAVAALLAPCVACSVLMVWYSQRAHHLSGVPIKHFAERQDGQPGYRLSGRPTADRPRVPITEDQFRAWDENSAESRRWAGRAAAFFPAAVLAVLLVGRLTGAFDRGLKRN